MTDIKELVKRLREPRYASSDWMSPINTERFEAADALEALAGEVERLRAAIAHQFKIEEGDEAEIAALTAERDRLKELLNRCLIGGNHLGSHKVSYWPDSGTDYDTAREALIPKYGVKEYDVWCCWNALMGVSKALGDAS